MDILKMEVEYLGERKHTQVFAESVFLVNEFVRTGCLDGAQKPDDEEEHQQLRHSYGSHVEVIRVKFDIITEQAKAPKPCE